MLLRLLRRLVLRTHLRGCWDRTYRQQTSCSTTHEPCAANAEQNGRAPDFEAELIGLSGVACRATLPRVIRGEDCLSSSSEPDTLRGEASTDSLSGDIRRTISSSMRHVTSCSGEELHLGGFGMTGCLRREQSGSASILTASRVAASSTPHRVRAAAREASPLTDQLSNHAFQAEVPPGQTLRRKASSCKTRNSADQKATREKRIRRTWPGVRACCCTLRMPCKHPIPIISLISLWPLFACQALADIARSRWIPKTWIEEF